MFFRLVKFRKGDKKDIRVSSSWAVGLQFFTSCKKSGKEELPTPKTFQVELPFWFRVCYNTFVSD
jgi:hypothetical protein